MTEQDWLEGLLAQRTRTLTDEYGTFYAHLEGGHGGQTVLLWLPYADAEAVLPQLPRQFRGRLVLGLDRSSGDLAPFARALHWAAPRYAVGVVPGEGLGAAFAGCKEVAEGHWVGCDEPGEALSAEVTAPTGFGYLERRFYPAWSGAVPANLSGEGPAVEGFRAGSAGWQAGIPTYAAGLVGLDLSLAALLKAWRMSE